MSSAGYHMEEEVRGDAPVLPCVTCYNTCVGSDRSRHTGATVSRADNTPSANQRPVWADSGQSEASCVSRPWPIAASALSLVDCPAARAVMLKGRMGK